jgi:hypothetical protein
MQSTDATAVAMRAAWERVGLKEKQVAMAALEEQAFQLLASQLGVSLDDLTCRAKLRHARVAL